MFKFLFVTTLLALFAHGDKMPDLFANKEFRFDATSSRIINGDDINIVGVPSQVGLYRVSINETLGSLVCGGSIITPNWVLTAGHCLFDENKMEKPAVSRVIAGSTVVRNGSVHEIAEKILHPSYEFVGNISTPLNDIAVLRVVQNFVEDATRKVVELYCLAGHTLDNSTGQVVGWGSTTKGDNGGYAETLKSIELKLEPKISCDTITDNLYNRTTNGTICARNQDKEIDVCDGDSGGGFVVNGKLVGVVAWGGKTCGEKGHPIFFTEVAYYRYWISNITSA